MPIISLYRLRPLIVAAVLLLAVITLSGCSDPWEDFTENLPAEEADPALPCSSEKEKADPDEAPDDSELSTGDAETNGTPSSKDSAGSDGQSSLPVISDGGYLLALVTKETTLNSTYKPADLKPIPASMFPARELYLREEALAYLIALWQAAEADGVILHILSAYRSYDYQAGLFQSYADRHGEEEANRFSARPGQSEHQLGTAVDFGGTAADFKADYAQTPQGRWLAGNAHRFGFAMSYPEGKEEVTGYIFEPWHYRYIGVEEAAWWNNSGVTLNEYLQNKPQYYE